jgi:hypothetical protein
MPGIEMSMTTTSGRDAAASLSAVSPSHRFAHHLHVRLSVDQELEAMPDRDVVVGEDDSQREVRVRHDRPLV